MILQHNLQRIKKGDKWGTAEVKELLSKGFEFIDIKKSGT